MSEVNLHNHIMYLSRFLSSAIYFDLGERRTRLRHRALHPMISAYALFVIYRTVKLSKKSVQT